MRRWPLPFVVAAVIAAVVASVRQDPMLMASAAFLLATVALVTQ